MQSAVHQLRVCERVCDHPPIAGPDVFYLGARPPSDWGQPSPPTPHPLLGCWEVCQLSLALTPVPGQWFWESQSLGLYGRWSFSDLVILLGGVIGV